MSNKYCRMGRAYLSLMIIAFFALFCSCSGNGSNLPENKDGTTATIGTGSTSGPPATNIALSATPSAIVTGVTSSIQATVTTGTGGNVSDGTVVSFTISSTLMGTVSSRASTSNGIARATFTASSVPGMATITAKVGNLSQTTVVTISAPVTGGVKFVSATAQKLGIKGSGQESTSTVKFLVNDINGNPVIDGTQVDFVLNGPGGGRLPSNGGEYIGDLDVTPTTATASTVSGYATVTLNSGSVPGPVTITASAVSGTQTFSASSSVISIGGGLPSASHFNLAATKINLPGLTWSNKTSDISAFIADRFGNYNVLKGSTVSFYTEAGAIDASNITDETGVTSVIFRTQLPDPVDVTAAIAGDNLSNRFFDGGNEPSYTSGGHTYNPRDGWVTILAAVQGEEGFEDANANGLYDTGESFSDMGEPFMDKNDNGIRDSSNPFEEYIDVNGNGLYDGPNGVWDGPGCNGTGCRTSKTIWTTAKLQFSGNEALCQISPASPFNVPNGGSQTFTFTSGDINRNWLVPGTSITVSATAGTLNGDTSYTIPDRTSTGPIVLTFNLTDPDISTATGSSTITVKVVPGEGVVGCEKSVTGNIQ